jgi:type II secretory pathway component PulJ
MKTNQRRKHVSYLAGFTLLELLISSVLVMLVMLAAYSAFFTGRNGYRSIEQRADQNQNTRVFIERLAKDLRNSFAFSPTDSWFNGSKTEMGFFTIREQYKINSLKRVFSRAGFLFKDSAVFIRYCDNAGSLDSAHQPEYNLLAENVKECSFSYGAFDGSSKAVVWKDAWSDPLSIPSAVRVSITCIRADQAVNHDIYISQ